MKSYRTRSSVLWSVQVRGMPLFSWHPLSPLPCTLGPKSERPERLQESRSVVGFRTAILKPMEIVIINWPWLLPRINTVPSSIATVEYLCLFRNCVVQQCHYVYLFST